MHDNKGSYAVIQSFPPGEPNVDLGFRLCPNRDQELHHHALLDADTTLCDTVAGEYLMECKAKQALFQWMIPKMDYGLYLTPWATKNASCLTPLFGKPSFPKCT